jgi:hypothetical protein
MKVGIDVGGSEGLEDVINDGSRVGTVDGSIVGLLDGLRLG